MVSTKASSQFQRSRTQNSPSPVQFQEMPSKRHLDFSPTPPKRARPTGPVDESAEPLTHTRLGVPRMPTNSKRFKSSFSTNRKSLSSTSFFKPRTLFSEGEESERPTESPKVKKGVHKPMKAVAIIDELPLELMRKVVSILKGRDISSLLEVSRGVHEDTIAALLPQTKLERAVQTANLKLLRIAINEGVDVNAKTDDGSTPLHSSTYHGHLEIVRYLIEEAGADVNAKDKVGDTPLHSSAYHGNLEIARYLIEKAGADIHARDKVGRTPLHLCAMRGHVKILIALIEAGADVNAKT